MATECSIVRDLLPLYTEGLVSEETATYIEAHLAECPACRAEYDAMKTPPLNEETEPLAHDDAAERKRRSFRTVMRRFNRRMHIVSYGLLLFLILFGFSLTEGSDLMFNSLIMPIVGILGYLIFGWQAIWKLPIVLVVSLLPTYLLGLLTLDPLSLITWLWIYLLFILVGYAITFLIHFAIGRFFHVKAS